MSAVDEQIEEEERVISDINNRRSKVMSFYLQQEEAQGLEDAPTPSEEKPRLSLETMFQKPSSSSSSSSSLPIGLGLF